LIQACSRDLKSDLKSWVPQGTCGFDARPRHQITVKNDLQLAINEPGPIGAQPRARRPGSRLVRVVCPRRSRAVVARLGVLSVPTLVHGPAVRALPDATDEGVRWLRGCQHANATCSVSDSERLGAVTTHHLLWMRQRFKAECSIRPGARQRWRFQSPSSPLAY